LASTQIFGQATWKTNGIQTLYNPAQKTICQESLFVILYKIFFRTILENGIPLRVHTNKSEGSWAHLKHKIKRIYGTNHNLLSSYIAEAVFRQNCRAKQWNILEKLFEQMSTIYN
jgi:hypothetical protein